MSTRPDTTSDTVPRHYLVVMLAAALVAVFGGAAFAGDPDRSPVDTPSPVEPDPDTGSRAVAGPDSGDLEVVEFGWSVSGDQLDWGAVVTNTSDIVMAGSRAELTGTAGRQDFTEIPALWPGEHTAVGGRVGHVDAGDLDELTVTVTGTNWVAPGPQTDPIDVTVDEVTAGWSDPAGGDPYWTTGELTEDPHSDSRSVVRFGTDSDRGTIWHPTATVVFRDADGTIVGVTALDRGRLTVPPGRSGHVLIVEFPTGAELSTVEVHLNRPIR